jgi:hypothetical protein
MTSHSDIDVHSPSAGEEGGGVTTHLVIPSPVPSLADPMLALAAAVLDDLERTRIDNQNRYRQVTRDEVDSDGELRGFGLDDNDPSVAHLGALVDGLEDLEHDATLNLQALMRIHPLGPWVQDTKGVGLKQAARLLAAIGDPYWNTLHGRPRTVSELWAYSGLHTLPVGRNDDAEIRVAARRQKGQRSNWSSDAKMRAYNISEAMLKAGNRLRYDERRAKTADRVHSWPCAPCGKKGKPAEVGTPWRPGHQHADGLRMLSKYAILLPLWEEARSIHLTHEAEGLFQ